MHFEMKMKTQAQDKNYVPIMNSILVFIMLRDYLEKKKEILPENILTSSLTLSLSISIDHYQYTVPIPKFLFVVCIYNIMSMSAVLYVHIKPVDLHDLCVRNNS